MRPPRTAPRRDGARGARVRQRRSQRDDDLRARRLVHQGAHDGADERGRGDFGGCEPALGAHVCVAARLARVELARPRGRRPPAALDRRRSGAAATSHPWHHRRAGDGLLRPHHPLAAPLLRKGGDPPRVSARRAAHRGGCEPASADACSRLVRLSTSARPFDGGGADTALRTPKGRRDRAAREGDRLVDGGAEPVQARRQVAAAPIVVAEDARRRGELGAHASECRGRACRQRRDEHKHGERVAGHRRGRHLTLRRRRHGHPNKRGRHRGLPSRLDGRGLRAARLEHATRRLCKRDGPHQPRDDPARHARAHAHD
mmetsp:Transcript_8865/g.19176  ORF Transcript_8865/g.19176 Transcript_8865/m.19176 type:complete len:316 (-) Transcript_8865:1504-2451(-)